MIESSTTYAGEIPESASQQGLASTKKTTALWWGLAAFLIAMVCFLYASIGGALAKEWYFFPDSSHGILIPFFVVFVLWSDRSVLGTAPRAHAWTGLSMVITGLLLLMVGTFGADLFLSRISFLVLVGGIVWTVFGLRMLGKTRFALFMLLLSIPLPALVFNHITFPLQIFASRFASFLLSLANVPVLREGNVIQLPAMKLEVAEACSGIRSLMSLFTMAVIYGYLLKLSPAKRTLLAISSVPIAVLANAARIFGTGICVQYGDAEKALGFFHEFSGWLMFLVSLGCLYLVYSLMNLAGAKSKVSR